MGRVYRARQTLLDKVVAVKVLHTVLSADERIQARFQREARAASRLSHPNSAQTLDFGVENDGVLYLVMEYLEGPDLHAVLHNGGPQPVERIVSVMSQVLGALAAAHDAGIVHRDLKPENILLVPRTGDDGIPVETVKVADFGIAKMVDDRPDGGGRLTDTGLVPGTPAYMSPEQAAGKNVDGRSDLYACGVILFEMATGQLPFNAESSIAVVIKHISEAPPPPSSICPTVDRGLEVVILRCLAKDPGQRYGTARELRAALRAVVGADSTGAVRYVTPALGIPAGAVNASISPTALLPGPALTHGPQSTDSAMARAPTVTSTQDAVAVPTPRPAPARRGGFVVGAAAVLAVCIVAAAFAARPPRRRPTDLVRSPVAAPGPTTLLVPLAPTPAPGSTLPVVPSPTPELIQLPEPAPFIVSDHGAAAARRAHDRLHPSGTAPTVPQTPEPAPVQTAVPVPVAAPAPVPVPVAAPVPVRVVAPTPAPQAELRGVHGDVAGLTVSAGVSGGAVRSRVERAAQVLAECVARGVSSHGGAAAFGSGGTARVTVSVRDRRVDAAQVTGGVPWASGCEGAVRAAFEGTLPEGEDTEYAIQFSVPLTPER